MGMKGTPEECSFSSVSKICACGFDHDILYELQQAEKTPSARLSPFG
jgi:hypothetical protein